MRGRELLNGLVPGKGSVGLERLKKSLALPGGVFYAEREYRLATQQPLYRQRTITRTKLAEAQRAE